MEEFFKALFSALSAELPFIAVLIIGAAMWLFGSTGIFIGGGKIDERAKKAFRVIGAILTYFGSITTLLTVSLSLWNFLQPYQPFMVPLWFAILKIFSPPVLWYICLIVGLAGLALFFVKGQVEKSAEKGYKIQVIPVVDRDDAGIQIENVGTGKVHCAARLIKVEWKSNRRDRYKEFDIHELNPTGRYLGWGQRSQVSAILSEDTPVVVDLINNTRGDANFVFFDFYRSKTIDHGFYKIKVKILRLKGRRWIDFDELEEELIVDYELEWIKRTKPPEGNE